MITLAYCLLKQTRWLIFFECLLGVHKFQSSRREGHSSVRLLTTSKHSDVWARMFPAHTHCWIFVPSVSRQTLLVSASQQCFSIPVSTVCALMGRNSNPGHLYRFIKAMLVNVHVLKRLTSFKKHIRLRIFRKQMKTHMQLNNLLGCQSRCCLKMGKHWEQMPCLIPGDWLNKYSKSKQRNTVELFKLMP